MNKSVAVIGQGFVGGSLTTVFAERGFTVYVNDKAGKIADGGIDPLIPEINLDERVQLMAGVDKEPIDIGELPILRTIRNFTSMCESFENFSRIYFVCLPTPMKADGSADLSIVETVLAQLADADGDRIAVVKSTVPPGSTERWNSMFNSKGLHVIFNPEFLREATALDDMRNQDRIVLGGPRPHINSVKEVFQSGWPTVKVIKTSSTTAEMVKYVTNIHLAVKVSLANEFAQICEALDAQGKNIDYDKVVEYATMDRRLGTSHWAVPGPMPADDGTGRHLRGFAGSCFVKDLNALVAVAKDLGVKPSVMEGAWQKNLEVRPEKDWERLVGRAVSEKK